MGERSEDSQPRVPTAAHQLQGRRGAGQGRSMPRPPTGLLIRQTVDLQVMTSPTPAPHRCLLSPCKSVTPSPHPPHPSQGSYPSCKPLLSPLTHLSPLTSRHYPLPFSYPHHSLTTFCTLSPYTHTPSLLISLTPSLSHRLFPSPSFTPYAQLALSPFSHSLSLDHPQVTLTSAIKKKEHRRLQ